MNIETALASRLYGASQTMAGVNVEEGDTSGPSFADAVEKALADMQSTVDKGERAAQMAMAGKGDIQSMVEALTATEMALDTAVAVRDKVVEAYQELLRMPV